MNERIHIVIGSSHGVEYANTGDSKMNEQFAKFYEIYFLTGIEGMESRLAHLWPNFFEVSEKYFQSKTTQDIALHDRYFENFTVITEILWKQGYSEQVCRIWAKIAEFIGEFEAQNYVLHKGSLFYFWSIPLILVERIDAGILALHRAVVEDQRSKPDSWRNNPAHQVLSMDLNSNIPYLKDFLVDPAVGFINRRISKYTEYRDRDFRYEELQSLFLQNEDFDQEMRYYFTLTIYKFQYIRRLSKLGLGQKTMSSLILNSTLGSMLMLWENILRKKYGERKLMYMVASLINDSGETWGNSTTRAQNAQRDANQNLKSFIEKRINKNLRQDILVAYALRNHSFHSLKDEQLLWENHTNLMQIVLNCIFVSLKS